MSIKQMMLIRVMTFIFILLAVALLAACKGNTYTFKEKKWQSTCVTSTDKMASADFAMQCSAGTSKTAIIQECADTGIKLICPMVLVCRETTCNGLKLNCESSVWHPCPPGENQ